MRPERQLKQLDHWFVQSGLVLEGAKGMVEMAA